MDSTTKKKLTDAFRQRYRTERKVIFVQELLLGLYEPTLAQLTVLYEFLVKTYREQSRHHLQVIGLIPDECLAAQEVEFEKYDALFFEVATALAELQIEAEQTVPSVTTPIAANRQRLQAKAWLKQMLKAWESNQVDIRDSGIETQAPESQEVVLRDCGLSKPKPLHEQAEVYRKLEAITDRVATSVEEMLLPQHASNGSMPESVSKTISASLNQGPTSYNQCRDVVHQATKPFETRSDPAVCRVSPGNSRDVAASASPEPLLPAKLCDSLPSGVTSQRRDTQSDTSNERNRKHFVEPPKQDPVSHRVSAGIHEDVAASASLQPLIPSNLVDIQVAITTKHDEIVNAEPLLPATELVRDQHNEANHSCVPWDSSPEVTSRLVKVPPVVIHDALVLRSVHPDGKSSAVFDPSSKPAKPTNPQGHHRANQDGGLIPGKDPLAPSEVKAPDKLEHIHTTPNSQPQTFDAHPSGRQTVRITSRTMPHSCVPISRHDPVTPTLTGADQSKPEANRCSRIVHSVTAFSTTTVDFYITLKHWNPAKALSQRHACRAMFVTSAPKKRFVVKAPDRTEDLAHKGSAGRQTLRHENVLQEPRPICIQQPLKDHSKSDFNRSQAPYEFCKPRKRLLRILDLKVRNVRKRRHNSVGPPPSQLCSMPDPEDKPPDDLTTRSAPAEDQTMVSILTHPWDPGTKSPLIVTAESDQVQPLRREVVQYSDDEANQRLVHSDSGPQTKVRIRKHTQNQIIRVQPRQMTVPKYQPLMQTAARAPDKRELPFPSSVSPGNSAFHVNEQRRPEDLGFTGELEVKCSRSSHSWSYDERGSSNVFVVHQSRKPSHKSTSNLSNLTPYKFANVDTSRRVPSIRITNRLSTTWWESSAPSPETRPLLIALEPSQPVNMNLVIAILGIHGSCHEPPSQDELFQVRIQPRRFQRTVDRWRRLWHPTIPPDELSREPKSAQPSKRRNNFRGIHAVLPAIKDVGERREPADQSAAIHRKRCVGLTKELRDLNGGSMFGTTDG